MNIVAGKDLDRVKSEKRLTKNNNWNKKQEDITKETNNTKESVTKNRHLHLKPNIKKEREVKAPVKGRTPGTLKNEVVPVKIPKGGRPSKPVKT